MKVILSINGYLNHFFEQKEYELELEEGATIAGLLAAVDSRFGESLPKSIWSREKKAFRGPISISVGSKKTSDLTFPLRDGQNVSVSRFLIGG